MKTRSLLKLVVLTFIVSFTQNVSAGKFYWVGGTGTWDPFATSNWSLTSNGTGGVGIPTLNDTVYFDAYSFEGPSGQYGNLLIDGTVPCSTIDLSMLPDSIDFSLSIGSTSPTIQLSGGINLRSKHKYSSPFDNYSGSLQFTASTGTYDVDFDSPRYCK